LKKKELNEKNEYEKKEDEIKDKKRKRQEE
jgi:hypothetical protein